MPRLVVVEVAITWRPPAANCSSKEMSSMLMSDIASCRVWSVFPIGVACASCWVVGVVIGVGVNCWTDFGAGY